MSETLENKDYTYKDGRKCLHCKMPIADQKHASLKFCPRLVLPDSSIKSCKDDYHSPRRKLANEPFNRLAQFHKRMYNRIHDLSKQSNGRVTLHQLNQWKIMLNRPIEFTMEGGMLSAFFFKYVIIQLSKTEFKIEEHGKQY